jgi:uncharacterized protein YcnI
LEYYNYLQKGSINKKRIYMNMKIYGIILSTAVLILSSTQSVFAHVVVKPSEAGVGQYVTFSIGVPPEKGIPTTALRVVIPDGIESVRPNVKPGWKIEIKRNGEAENAKVTEIVWSGGSIPADQRDEFVFSAKVPAQATSVIWKAYQTYGDGSIVSWDQAPAKDEEKKDDDSENTGPYSQTKIIDDLKAVQEPIKPVSTGAMSSYMGYSALALSIVALIVSLRKK